MCILQGLRELSVVEELEVGMRFEKGRKFVQNSVRLCHHNRHELIFLVAERPRHIIDTSGRWIMFTKTPEQGRTRGKERQIQHNNLQIAETPRHGAFLFSIHLMYRIFPVITPMSPWTQITWLQAADTGSGTKKGCLRSPMLWDQQRPERDASLGQLVCGHSRNCINIKTTKDDWYLTIIFNFK